jgi:hypothetical protein
MAGKDGKVDVIISEMAMQNIKDAIELSDQLLDNILKINSTSRSNNNPPKGGQTPADAAAAANKRNEFKAEQIRLENAELAVLKQVAVAEKKVNEARKSGFKDVVKANQQRAETIKKIKAESNEYTKQNHKFLTLKKRYRDLAISQELQGDLSKKQVAEMKKLEIEVNKMDKAFKKVDAGMGQHNRSVGNYKKGFDSLGFSVAQITRESPAFINSMNTGFMAISNNLPIFVDEINKLTAANKALVAQGKPTVSVFKQIGKAFLSWQSLISVAIVLLTLYGSTIVKWVGEMIKGTKAINAQEAALDALNEAYEESAKTISKQISNNALLFKVAADTTKSIEVREKAVNELIDSNKGLIAEEDSLRILQGDFADGIDSVTEALLRRAVIQALINQNEELFEKLILNRITIGKTQKNQEEERAKIGGALGVLMEDENSLLSKSIDLITEHTGATKEGLELAIKDGLAKSMSSDAIELESKKKEENKQIQDEINAIIEEAIKLVDELTFGWDKAGTTLAKYSDVSLKFMPESIGWLEKMISMNNQIIAQTDDEELRVKLTEENIEWAEQVRLMKEAIDFQVDLNRLIGGDTSVLKTPTEEEELDDDSALIAEGDRLIKLREQQAKNLTKALADQEQDRIDLALQGFDAIVAIGDALFDEKLDRIDREIEAEEEKYDKLFELAEGDDEQQRLLAIQQEEDRKKLEKKKAKAEKEAFLFRQAAALAEVGINTALAISNSVAVAASLPPFASQGYLAAQLAIILASAGIQTAVIAAQTIPKFAKGGVMDKDGLAIVGDGGRKEVITNPDGSIQVTPDKSTVVGLQKGAKIHSSINAFERDMPTDMKDMIRSATVLATLSLNQSKITDYLESQRVMDGKLLEAMQNNTDAIKKQKLRVTNNNQKVDIAHDLYKMRYLS